ncbi:UNVERIFIED_CONTAM: hypothetical protein RMT77_007010 [Armadillidium vulgare]
MLAHYTKWWLKISDITEKEHESEYEEILTGVKGNAAERRLSSQFIARFFHLFPNQQEQALNSQFDLCEDDDISIRKQAIKDLPSFCKAKPDLIPKVADILAQLLQMEDQGEIIMIQNALTTLFKIDAKGSLTGLFYQIENSDDENVRERCMKFLQSKIKTLGHEIFKTEAEELIIKESKTVLQEASEEEFLLMMSILKELRVTKSLKGYQHMVDLVAEQCNLSQSLDTTNLESVHRLNLCLKQALPYFSSQIRSTKFVEYMCHEVMPFIDQVDCEKMTEEGHGAASITLELLRTFAELISYADNLEDVEDKVNTVFAQLLEVMPLPPDTDTPTETVDEPVSLEFSRVECLLYIFHQLAKHHKEFLADNPERLKDFRLRLQYFARGSHAYQKKLRETLAEKKGEELKTEENNIKLIALKTTANINTLIKDLFHQPPSYKSTMTLSWKIPSSKSASEKRHTPITFESSPNKVSKSERQIYAPPRDKYSRNAGQFVRGRGRGRGRDYGGFRGYGSYRGNYRKF